MTKEFNFSTKERYQLVDITTEIEEAVKKSNVKNGLLSIFTPHSTAGILITENESGLTEDWINFFKKTVSGFRFNHDKIDNNADSHILSGLVGQDKSFPVLNCQIIRGTWQQIFLAEFDGPRQRKVILSIINSKDDEF